MTDYAQWSLPDLLKMLQTEPLASIDEHMKAWGKKKTLLSDQATKLRSLTAELSQYWDPAKSKAASAFIGQLTEMTSQLDIAARSADTSVRMLLGTMDALTTAKSELEKLNANYTNSDQANHEYNADKLGLPDFMNPNFTVPGFDDNAMRAHQSKLDDQARAVMTTSDQHVYDSAALLVQMPAMDPILESPAYIPVDDRNTGSHHTTVNTRSGSGSSSPTYVAPPKFNPPPPSVYPPPPGFDDPIGDSPILTTGPGLAPPPPAPVKVMPVGGPTPLPPVITPVGPAVPPWLTRTPGRGPAPRTGIGEPKLQSKPVTSRYGTPVKGVLGDEPPMRGGRPSLPVEAGGLNPAGRAGTGGRSTTGRTGTGTGGRSPSARGGTPVEGTPGQGVHGESVIGHGSGGRGTTGRGRVGRGTGPAGEVLGQSSSRAGGRPVPGQREPGEASRSQGGWQDRAFARYAEQRAGKKPSKGDGDDPWEVEDGVTPVLEAPRPPAGHDAGSGVIGIDR